jgi:mannitol-1-/sugar-/sorbitol-6-phosphatase
MPAVLTARALLFDLDGVLADSTASVERHWRSWARKHSLDEDALIAVVHGRRALDTIREVTPHLDAERELAALVDAEAGDTSDVTATPGAKALLARLPRDAWAVVTSGVRSVAEARLRASGLPMPTLLVPADEIARGKPDPEGYLTAARKLGLAPEHCVVIEDAPAGIAAARNAGMQCVALTTTHSAHAVAHADLIVASLAALGVHIARRDGGTRYTLSATSMAT